MKLKLIAPLLLSLIAAPASAHGNHDDDETTQAATPPPPKVGAQSDAPKSEPATTLSDNKSAASEAEAGKPAPKKP